MSTLPARSMRHISSACANLGRAYWLISEGRETEAQVYIGRALFRVHQAKKSAKKEAAQK